MLALGAVLFVAGMIGFVVWFVKNRDREAGRIVIKASEKVAETAESLARKAGV